MEFSAELCGVLANRLGEIPALAAAVERFLQAFDVPAHTVFQINLALEELIANTISYGYPEGGTHAIRVTIALVGAAADPGSRLGPGEIRIRLEDDAAPYDPFARAPADTGASLDERRIGGLGVHLVKEMIDRVDYRRVGGCNETTLRHAFAPAAAPGDTPDHREEPA